MNKRITILLVVFLLASIVLPVTASNNYLTDWVCFQRDEYRRGQTDNRQYITAAQEVQWTADIGGTPARTIIVGKNIAVVGTTDGKVSGFNLSSGERLWTNDLKINIASDLALSNEFVCVPLEGGKVVGLDLYTGGVFWEMNDDDSSVISPLPTYSQFFTVTEDGTVRSLQSADGKSYWKHNLETKVVAPPSMLTSGITNVSQMVIPVEGNKILIFNYQEQTIDWEYSLDGPSSHPVIPTGESLIVTEDSGRVFCLDSRSKQLYWNHQIDENITIESTPTIFNSYGFYACASTDGKVYAYRIGDGYKLWFTDTKSSITQPLIGVGQSVIVCTDDGHIKGFHAQDGSLVFDVSLEEKISSAPSFSSGVIVVATESGKLYGISAVGGGSKLSLDPEIVVINPGGEVDVKIKLDGSEEIAEEKFYLTPRGFPCRCKITRDIKPDNIIKVNEEKTLHLTADDKAPSYAYDYNILCKSYNPSIPEMVVNGVILVATESSMMKVFMNPTVEDKMHKVGVEFEGASFLKSFCSVISYDPEVLEPVSVTKTMPLAKNLYWDFGTPGKARVFVSFTESEPYNGDGSPFEVMFKGIATGTDTLKMDIFARSNSGTIIPARSVEAEVNVEKSTTKHVVSLQINNPVAKIDDTEVTLDVAPYIKAGRTMVPLRFVGEAMGAGVEWIDSERAVVYTNTLETGARSIKVWIGKTTALVDGAEMEMDAAPEINNGRTCVGVSFVSKNFGVETGWDGTTKTVTLSYEN